MGKSCEWFEYPNSRLMLLLNENETPCTLAFILTTGRVPDRVEDHRLSYVPGRLHMEATNYKQLLSERWRSRRGGGGCSAWGRSEERAAQGWVSMSSRHSDMHVCYFSSVDLLFFCKYHSDTDRGWRHCLKSSLQAEKTLPMPCCSVSSERMQQRKLWDTSLNLFPCFRRPFRKRPVCFL